MTTSRRFAAPVVGLLLAFIIAACDTAAVPGTPLPSPTSDAAALAGYSDGICPVFVTLLELDPRLMALREAGAGSAAYTTVASEVDAVSAELLELLEALEATPVWEPGVNLRYHLITALHGMRARLLRAADTELIAELAEIPFIASTAMDRSMIRAQEGGLACFGD